MGRRRYYRRRSSSTKDSLAAWIIIGIIGTLSQMNIETIIFYTVLVGGVTLTAFILYKRYKRNVILESGIDIIDKMDGVKFEELLLVHFQKQGYKGQLTPATNDYGADLVIEKNGEKTVVQAKRWKQVVGIEAVQQAIGAIKHYSAAKGMVITNSNFTQQAKNLAKTNNIELWDRGVLISFLRSHDGREMAESVFSSEAKVGPSTTIEESSLALCPECGKKLTIRSGKYGRFFGCSGYPMCRYTKELEV